MHMNTPHSQQAPLFDDHKPVRVTVPVHPEVLAAFQRLAAASGVSTGKAMGEWLEDTLEGALAMAEMLEKARQAPKQAVRQMHGYALGLTDLTSGLMDELARKSAGAGKRGKAIAATGAAGGGTVAAKAAPAPLPPRTVIRGGKSPKTPKKPKGD